MNIDREFTLKVMRNSLSQMSKRELIEFSLKTLTIILKVKDELYDFKEILTKRVNKNLT